MLKITSDVDKVLYLLSLEYPNFNMSAYLKTLIDYDNFPIQILMAFRLSVEIFILWILLNFGCYWEGQWVGSCQITKY